MRPPKPSRAIVEWSPVLLIFLAVVALHGGSIPRPFFADDYFFLEQARGHSFWAVVSSPDPLGNFLRPVSRQVYFWVLSHAGGESPALFHSVNLAIFLACLLALYVLARRLAGRTAAVFAIAFAGLHYAADVPLRWASGSQDLLAILFATLAVYLHVNGRRGLAAIAFLFGVLSKEAVAGGVIVAIVAGHTPGGRWGDTFRRGLALLGVALGWGLWWLWSLGIQPGAAHSLSFDVGSVPAAFVHLVQVALGWEVRLGGGTLGHWGPLALMTALIAGGVVWLVSSGVGSPAGDREAPRTGDDARDRAKRIALVWSVAATLPVVVVMPIWSAYFYLWALFGIGLLLGVLTTEVPAAARAAIVAVLVFFSANARALDEFAPAGGAWSWQSHVNRHYLDRGLSTVETYLDQLRSARPTLPHRSVVFFANVPVSSGWQAGDGPLLRWAYRDPTLRSYFLTQFSRERARRGPLFFFAVEGDSLKDKTNDPQLLPSFAFSMILAERPQATNDALDLAMTGSPGSRDLHYWRALARWALNDSLGAMQDLRDAGMSTERTRTRNEDKLVLAAIADTASRIQALIRARNRHGLDPWVHARLAATLLASGNSEEGAIEAYAYRVFDPADPDAWRKWSSAQIARGQYTPALASLEQYLSLSGAQGRSDREAQQVAESLRRLTRGDLAHHALRAEHSPGALTTSSW